MKKCHHTNEDVINTPSEAKITSENKFNINITIGIEIINPITVGGMNDIKNNNPVLLSLYPMFLSSAATLSKSEIECEDINMITKIMIANNIIITAISTLAIVFDAVFRTTINISDASTFCNIET